MSRTSIFRLFALTLFLLIAWVAYTQTQPPQLTITQVKDDLYYIEGDGGNVAVYITNEGVILVDDKYDQDHDQIMAKVKSVTAQPVKYIFSTHHHADHSGGNAKFLPTAEIISTANARANIVAGKQGNAPPGVAPRADRVHPGEFGVSGRQRSAGASFWPRPHQRRRARLFSGAAHSPHRRPDVRLHPSHRLSGGGSVVEWTKTLDEAMKLDFDTVIPGHGKVTNKAGLLAYRNNVEKLRNRATGMIREGKSQEDVGKVMMAEFGWVRDRPADAMELAGFDDRVEIGRKPR
jgi:glyoxylase-like metal-dependent hydrolase (beta-lactamase superfamily II)